MMEIKPGPVISQNQAEQEQEISINLEIWNLANEVSWRNQGHNFREYFPDIYGSKPVDVTFGKDDIKKVSLGYPKNASDGSKVVYIVDEEANTLQPWFTIDAAEIKDGYGTKITDLDSYDLITYTLNSIDEAVLSALDKKVADFDMQSHAEEVLERTFNDLKERLFAVQAAREQVQAGCIKQVEIGLHSLWEREGGKSLDPRVYILNEEGLPGAIRRAIKDYKAVSGRTDLQANVSVSIIVNEQRVNIPNQVFEEFVERNKDLK
jgi:hypothetical protein